MPALADYGWPQNTRVIPRGDIYESPDITDTAATSMTESITVPEDTDIMFVKMGGKHGGGVGSAGVTPTFNGVSLNLLGYDHSGFSHWAAIWDYDDPPATTADFVSPHPSIDSDSNTNHCYIIHLLGNVDKTTPHRAAQIVEHSNVVVTDDVVSELGDVVLACWGANSGVLDDSFIPYLWETVRRQSHGGAAKYHNSTTRAGEAGTTTVAYRASTDYAIQCSVAYVPRARDQKVDGTVTEGGVAVEGATVTVRNQTTGVLYTGTTDAAGLYSITVDNGYLYEITVEWEDGGTQYHAPSLWDVAPVAV